MDWTRGEGVDVTFDTVGGKVLQDSFTLTRYGGDVVTLLQPANDIDWTSARVRNLRISLELMLTPVMNDLAAGRENQGRILARCNEYFDNSDLQIHVADTFALQNVQQAHIYLEQQHPMGKLVLTL
jgi:NADPH2:quinone reductase